MFTMVVSRAPYRWFRTSGFWVTHVASSRLTNACWNAPAKAAIVIAAMLANARSIGPRPSEGDVATGARPDRRGRLTLGGLGIRRRF